MVICIADADQTSRQAPADLKKLIEVLQSAAKEQKSTREAKTGPRFSRRSASRART